MDIPVPAYRQTAEAERATVKYLKYEAFAGAERCPRKGRPGEPMGIGGVPYTTIRVRHEGDHQLQSWITDLLGRREADGNSFCLLVVRTKGVPTASWDAYLPPMWDLAMAPEPTPESEAWTWVRMDLRLAVVHLSSAIRTWGWAETYSLSTGLPPTLSRIQAWNDGLRTRSDR